MKILILLLLFVLSCGHQDGVYYELPHFYDGEDVSVVKMYHTPEKRNDIIIPPRWTLLCEKRPEGNLAPKIFEIDVPEQVYNRVFLGRLITIIFKIQYKSTYANNKLISQEVHNVIIYHIRLEKYISHNEAWQN